MGNRTRIVIYGTAPELAQAECLLRSCDCLSRYDLHCIATWNALQQELAQEAPALLVVLTDGAAGMEGVYLARQMMPELPVFWFSNDSQFGMQSHRLDCSYFATKPLTDSKLQKALIHCDKMGIHL